MPRGVHLGWSKETDPDSFCFQGYINLGTSENKLCLDLIKERVSHVLDFAETRTLWVWFPDLYLGLWQVQGGKHRYLGDVRDTASGQHS